MKDEPDLTAELDAADDIVMSDDGPAASARHLWSLADEVGNTKLAYRHALTPEERRAFDVVTQRLLRLGTQVSRGEVAP